MFQNSGKKINLCGEPPMKDKAAKKESVHDFTALGHYNHYRISQHECITELNNIASQISVPHLSFSVELSNELIPRMYLAANLLPETLIASLSEFFHCDVLLLYPRVVS